MKVKAAVAPKVSDAAVQAKTGKTWAEWFKTLDAAGARKLTHTEIARFVFEEQRISGWWSQMVTVAYEQARGLRQKHEKPGGFEISGSKTIEVSVGEVFAAWENAKQRRQWLADAGFTIRRATPDKTLRITWVDGKTSLDVYFLSKGVGKSQVTVQHSKLSSARQAERMRKYWGEQLVRLKGFLES